MARRRAARKAIRRVGRRAARAVKSRRGKNGATFGGISPKGAIKGAIGISVVRKLPIYNSMPPQYKQPAQMLTLGLGGKFAGISGMQHFTSTGISYALANFMETSDLLGGLGGILGGNTKTTTTAQVTP